MKPDKRKKRRDTGAIGGKFFYSARQRRELDKKGRHRTFASIFGRGIIEYTELVPYEDMVEDPTRVCEYEDAEYLGEGFFHHAEDPKH
jgi:hypothetical protein